MDEQPTSYVLLYKAHKCFTPIFFDNVEFHYSNAFRSNNFQSLNHFCDPCIITQGLVDYGLFKSQHRRSCLPTILYNLPYPRGFSHVPFSMLEKYIDKISDLDKQYSICSCNPLLPSNIAFDVWLDDVFLSYAGLNMNTNNNNDNKESFLAGTNIGPVINLSSFQLTPSMIHLLSKGLNFCPTPGEPDRYQLRKDLDKFHVSLRRKLFFDKSLDSAQVNSTTFIVPTDLDTVEDEEDTFDNYHFRNPSSWSPTAPFQLEAFVTFNESILNEYKFPAPSQNNLNYKERQALAELQKASNIIIKPADKGSAVVIQNLEDYINEGVRQLSNHNFYVETKDDLTPLHNELITNLINYLENTDQISKKCGTYLRNDNPVPLNCIYFQRYTRNRYQYPADL